METLHYSCNEVVALMVVEIGRNHGLCLCFCLSKCLGTVMSIIPFNELCCRWHQPPVPTFGCSRTLIQCLFPVCLLLLAGFTKHYKSMTQSTQGFTERSEFAKSLETTEKLFDILRQCLHGNKSIGDTSCLRFNGSIYEEDFDIEGPSFAEINFSQSYHLPFFFPGSCASCS